MKYQTLAHFRHFSHIRHFNSIFTNDYQISTNSYVRIYKLFMQNKPNLRNDKMNITLGMASNYKISSRWTGQKTKPIQTQFKANKAKNKPNLSQNKANSNPIVERAKLMQSMYIQRIKRKIRLWAMKKQTQFRPTHHRLEIRAMVV